MDFWTSARMRQLRDLLPTGMSASEIAAEIGASRNAVISKVHRTKDLSFVNKPTGGGSRAAARRPRPAKPAPVKAPNGKMVSPPVDDALARVEQLDASATGGVTFAELKSGHCRWPSGDPRSLATFRYCGAPKLAGCPYCALHARVSYNAPPPRRARPDRRP
jgi:GcrA cell cycle regulator